MKSFTGVLIAEFNPVTLIVIVEITDCDLELLMSYCVFYIYQAFLSFFSVSFLPNSRSALCGNEP